MVIDLLAISQGSGSSDILINFEEFSYVDAQY